MSDVANHYLSFRVGRQWYGIGVESVVEVLHLVALTELPAAAPDVLGLMTLREMVIPVIDLRRRFGQPEAPLHLHTPIIVVHGQRGPIGLVIDEADDVERITEAQMAVYEGGDSPYVQAVAKLEGGRLLLILDTSLLSAETVPAQP